MADLDELDAMHASLPALEAFAQSEVEGETVAIATVPYGEGTPFGEDIAAAAVAILNAWPEVSRELRERRGNQKCGDGACRYRPAEVTFDGKTVTVMNSRDAHVLADAVSELAALRALAEVVKAQCDWAHPGWVPEIREALALVEKAKAP